MSTRPELLIRQFKRRAKVLRTSALAFRARAQTSANKFRIVALERASRFAIKTSDRLSRAVFIGLIALACSLPFAIKRETLIASAPPSETLKTRSAVPQAVSSTSPKPTAAREEEPPSLSETKPAMALPDPKEEKPVPPSEQQAPPWSDREIAAAKSECDRLLEKVTYVAEELPPAREGICGAPAPRLLRSLGPDKTKIDPPATLSCPMIAAMNTWVSEKLQTAAKENFNSPVVRIIAGSYSCRNRYGLARAPISEHALMNAIDISAFVLANGKVIRVSKGWKPPHEPEKNTADTEEQDAKTDKAKAMRSAAAKLGGGATAAASVVVKVKVTVPKRDKQQEASSAFLHQAHSDACSLFGTVLGPEANEAHRDHFHLDMKARRFRSICH
ncbi:extensin family protein [Hyphomicrobium methylovorum]|uniref:extensin family protein n=1 Tax=Hyphomicrobium methylovorum TaxID=84 RepID=UPI0031B5E9FC